MQRALESALAELTLGQEIAVSDAPGILAWLLRHGVEGEDAEALTRDFPRLLVYRKLVRSNFREALRAVMPRSLARLGARFEPHFDEFLLARPPVTHYLRELTPRFLDFALPRWAADSSLPGYISDLARHEALQVEVASLLARPKNNLAAELSVDLGVEFIDAVRLVHYDWAVHRLPDDETSVALPERAGTSLLVYRSPEHDVRYLELGPFAAALLAGLLGRRLSLRAALTEAAQQVGLALDDELLSRAARLLAELAERGALLGRAGPAQNAAQSAADLLPKTNIPA
ncbi:MAG TPA: putative DNA-binding domain-containing protein [Polyangiaceae bacterium]